MREGMNRQDYINTMLAQIDQEQMREEIEKELSAHIDDREEYYREIGFDSDTAAEKAVAHMGSPEAAADGFNKVHKKCRLIPAILAVLSSVLVVPLFGFIILFFCSTDSVMGAGITEALFLLYVLGFSLLGKRRNSRIICAVAVTDFVLMYGTYLLKMLHLNNMHELCSRIVLKLTCLLTFDFDCLSAFWRVGGITVAPYLTYLSIAFYAVIFILLILVQISVGKLKRPTYGLRTKQFTSIVFQAQKGMCIFIAATMLILPIGPFDETEGMTVKPNTYFNSVIIAQSDTPRPISEIPKEDYILIGSNYDWSKYIDDLYAYGEFKEITCTIAPEDMIGGRYMFGGHYLEKEFANKLTYKIAKYDVECALTKDYVYIEFFNDFKSDSSPVEIANSDNVYKFVSDSPENWYAVDSAGEISAAVDAYSQIEITVSKKSS